MKTIWKAAAMLAATTGVAVGVQADTLEQTRDVSTFNRVQLSGSVDVEVKVGPEQSVRVVADDHVIDHLLTKVRGDTLVIELEDGHYGRIKKLDVFVTAPSLEGAGVHGSGDMVIENAASDEFELEVHGSGDVIARNTNAGSLEIGVHGSGDVRIDGTCEDVNISVHGSGDVQAVDMQCVSADVSVQGSGDVSLYASKSAALEVMGSGDITVAGAPDKIRSSVHGSGDIHVR